jgi:hypothetical protein
VLGDSISFDILLKGDQLEGTNVVPYAGFEFSVFQGLSYVWLSPAGFASAEAYIADGVPGTDAVPQITITPIAIPEPAAAALFIAAASALVAVRRK